MDREDVREGASEPTIEYLQHFIEDQRATIAELTRNREWDRKALQKLRREIDQLNGAVTNARLSAACCVIGELAIENFLLKGKMQEDGDEG